MSGKLLLLTAMTVGTACGQPAPDPPLQNIAPTPVVADATAIQSVGPGGGWTLVFADEFDGTSLDSRKWVTCYWWNKHGCTNQGNRELQWYQSGNVTVADGRLRLRAEPTEARGDDGTLYNYTSGLVSTGRDVED